MRIDFQGRRDFQQRLGFALSTLVVACFICTAASESCADNLRSGEGVIHSRNQELALYRFGYTGKHHRRPNTVLPPHSRLGRNSELIGYHLDDQTESVEDELNRTELSDRAGLELTSPAERLTSIVQQASETLVGGFVLAMKEYFGGEEAFADSPDEELEAADLNRDALVHF